MMKVLQVINNLGSGGAEKLLVDFLPYLEKYGCEVDVVLLQCKDSIHIDKVVKRNINIKFLTQRSCYSILNIFRLMKYMNRYDVVHVHLFPSLYFIAIAKILVRSKTQLVFTEHSNNNRRMSNSFYRFCDRIIYKKYSAIVCITNTVRESLEHELGKGRYGYNLTVIPNGIDLTNFQTPINIRRQDVNGKLTDNDVLVTMIGRFCYPKNQKNAIEALLYLPENVKLLFIGNGSTYNECKKLVDTLNLHARVFFAGIRDDISQILRISDIGLLSSDYEGMPLSVLEVMAAKIPFVGSNVVGIRDLVEDNGLLFDNLDPCDLASNISLLMNNSNLKEELVQRAWTFVQRYSIEVMAQEYMTLYEKNLNKS